MPRPPRWVWLVLAGLFGLAAALMAVGWLRQPSGPSSETGIKCTSVVLAARDIEAATELTPDLLRADPRWPLESLPKGSFSGVEKLKGRVTAPPWPRESPSWRTGWRPKGPHRGSPRSCRHTSGP